MTADDSYLRHYRRVNDLSPEGRRRHWGYLAACIGPYLPRSSDGQILDIGCGTGVVLEWVSSKGFPNARGIDTDSGQVEQARQLGLEVSNTASTIEYLQMHPGSYDLVVLKDVLEHCPSEEVGALLKGVCEQLAPGGRVYLSVPNANASFATRWRYIDPTHRRSYTEHSLRWDIERAGLEVLSIAGDDYWRASSLAGLVRLFTKAFFRSVRRLEALAEFGPDGWHLVLSLNMVAVARKP
jgi:SAM-dependent methyltransferase